MYARVAARLAGFVAAGVVVVWPRAAGAHEIIPGVTGFPAMLLHPLVLFDTMIALVAGGLLLGQKAPSRIAGGVAAVVCGVLVGSVDNNLEILPAIVIAVMPLVMAGVGGGLVAAAVSLPFSVTCAFLLVIGFSVGTNMTPELPTPRSIAEAVTGAAIASAIVAGALAAVVRRLEWNWARIGVRIVGSWIAASTLMVVAFVVSRWLEWMAF